MGAVIAVDPPGDGVSAEVEDLSAVGVEIVDDPGEETVDLRDEFLRPALRPELADERLSEGSEAGDVGEDGRPAHVGLHRTAGGQRAASVAGDVGARIVGGPRGGHDVTEA